MRSLGYVGATHPLRMKPAVSCTEHRELETQGTLPQSRANKVCRGDSHMGEVGVRLHWSWNRTYDPSLAKKGEMVLLFSWGENLIRRRDYWWNLTNCKKLPRGWTLFSRLCQKDLSSLTKWTKRWHTPPGPRAHWACARYGHSYLESCILLRHRGL